MLLSFTRKLEFQFGFFFHQSRDIAPSDVLGLSDFFVDSKRLPVTVSPGVQQEGLTSLPGAEGTLLQIQSVLWSGPLWRMVWNPLRFDIYLKAHVYEETGSKPLTVTEVAQRVSLGLVRSADRIRELGGVVHRTVTGVQAEADLLPGSKEALALFAAHGFNASLVEGVNDGSITDLAFRVDRPGALAFGEETVPLHRIETLGTMMAYAGKVPVFIAKCNWDVNTSPGRGVDSLPPEGVGSFYEASARWIDTNLGKVRG